MTSKPKWERARKNRTTKKKQEWVRMIDNERNNNKNQRFIWSNNKNAGCVLLSATTNIISSVMIPWWLSITIRNSTTDECYLATCVFIICVELIYRWILLCYLWVQYLCEVWDRRISKSVCSGCYVYILLVPVCSGNSSTFRHWFKPLAELVTLGTFLGKILGHFGQLKGWSAYARMKQCTFKSVVCIAKKYS